MRIEYKDYIDTITEQQALVLGSYEKIYYDDSHRRLREESFYKGVLRSIAYYLQPQDDEEQMVEKLFKEVDTVDIIESTAVGPYFVEREREYIKGTGLTYECEYVRIRNAIYNLYRHCLFSHEEETVDDQLGEIILPRKMKEFIYDGYRTFTFFYHDDNSFDSCDEYIEGGYKDEHTAYNSFEEIVFPEEGMPIKPGYFATGDPDPTGFEIS